MDRFVAFILFFVLGVFFFPGYLNAHCYKHSCNPSLNYAMGKQAASISARMGDLIGAFREMTKATKKNNYLSAKELIELMRIQQRYRIRTMELMEQSFHYRVFKKEANNGGAVSTILLEKKLDHKEGVNQWAQ